MLVTTPLTSVSSPSSSVVVFVPTTTSIPFSSFSTVTVLPLVVSSPVVVRVS